MKSFLCFCAVVFLACQTSVAQESALKRLDKNSDGKISAKEFKGHVKKRFPDFEKADEFASAVDSNSDGEISEAEFQKRKAIYASLKDENEVAEETGAHVVGDTASDFELQSIGETIRLSDRFGEDGKPVVVVFSRANW